MNIIFLCGSLEPGRDGVGDYTRRLAVELSRQGHRTAGVALNDPHITQEDTAAQAMEGGTLPVLRLPASWPVDKRFERAQQWVDAFGAEWISLQFVPFAFHPKGLPYGLDKYLANLVGGRSLHLMVHELWVGMDRAAPTKLVWWGRLQRLLIKSLFRTLQPKVIHTQTPLYQAQLAKLGFTSQLLPLFANIPVDKGAKHNAEALMQPSSTSKTEGVQLVLFGSIHPGAPVEQFAREAAEYARQHAVPVALTMVGRCGNEQKHWVAAWEKQGLPLQILGEQEPQRISEVLLHASLGIATTPAPLIGKSGTAVAMQEHGLPVLCVSHQWTARGIKELKLPDGIAVYSEGGFAKCLAEKKQAIAYKVSDIALKLSSSLEGEG